MANLPSIPGQEMEKAAAEVTSAAGKSLVKALSKIANAWAARASARMEADAAELKKEIVHAGTLKRSKAAREAEREQQLLDIEHAYALRQRAIGRLTWDVVDEQRVIEHVLAGATKRIEADLDNGNPRELDPDWLRRFFNYVSQVDEESVLEVFMSALANAGIEGRPIVPAKALDTLRFFTLASFKSFMDIARQVLLFGHATEWQVEQGGKADQIGADIELLLELGLLKSVETYHVSAQVGRFHVNVSYDPGTIFRFDTLKLTQAGRAIVDLVDKDLSRLGAAMGDRGRGEEVWKLQVEYGARPDDVKVLASGLVAAIHDSTCVRIHIKHLRPERSLAICDVERRDVEQPFAIRNDIYDNLPESDDKTLFDNFVLTFDEFDRETLPAIRNLAGKTS